jgi:hypothetical protein
VATVEPSRGEPQFRPESPGVLTKTHHACGRKSTHQAGLRPPNEILNITVAARLEQPAEHRKELFIGPSLGCG